MASAEYYAHEHLGEEADLEEGSPAAQAAEGTLEAAAEAHPAASADAPQRQALSPSEALRQKHTHLLAVERLAKLFQGSIVDVSHDSVVIQVAGKASRIDAFLKLVRPFGILEAARTGSMVMPRSHVRRPVPSLLISGGDTAPAQIESAWQGMTDDEPAAEMQEAIDAGLLPPG
jgi:acetolactate synthase-1/3 small subunit